MQNNELQNNEWQRIVRLERRVDYLIRYLGVNPADVDAGLALPGAAGSPAGGLEVAPQNEAADMGLAPVYDAIRRRKTIEAIRLYRELTGASLQEARFAVEAIARDA
jgi:ribosomal protein L7/L12